MDKFRGDIQDDRYEDMFFGLHGHFSDQHDPECSLCGPQ